MRRLGVLLLAAFLTTGCSGEKVQKPNDEDSLAVEITEREKASDKTKDVSGKTSEILKLELTSPKGRTIEERFNLPEGFERVKVEKGSFQEYLRKLPLKPHGSKVLYYDGREKDKSDVYEAVVDVEIGKRDLHQCADAVMLLRAEYLLKSGRTRDIHFNFVNGFKADYSKWTQGWRIKVNGNNVSWVRNASESDSYESFRKYMDMVFAYAGTLSLEKELKSIDKEDMDIGDVFIKGASPGHAVIVVDMAINKDTGEKLFMLAQSYMPAQQTQILCNNNEPEMSPWYSLNYEGKLYTPEWVFEENSLRRFEN